MSIFRFLFWHAFYSLRQKLWPFMLSKKREKSLGLLTFYSLCIDGMIKKWFIIAWWQEKGTKMRYFDRQVSNFDIYQLGIFIICKHLFQTNLSFGSIHATNVCRILFKPHTLTTHIFALFWSKETHSTSFEISKPS